MWYAPFRPAGMSTRRRTWRTCTDRIGLAAPRPGRLRSRPRNEERRNAEGASGRAALLGGIVTADRPPAPQSRPLKSRVRRWLSLSLVVVFMATAAVLSGGAWWIASLGPPPLGGALGFSPLGGGRRWKVVAPLPPAGRTRAAPSGPGAGRSAVSATAARLRGQ